MNDLQPYRTEIRALVQAAVNVRLAQEGLEIVKDLDTLQRNYQGQHSAILGIVVLLVKSRGGGVKQSVGVSSSEKHNCKSGKGKEQKDESIFQPGMSFFVFERLFHSGKQGHPPQQG
jgi:hypothetical protein